MLARLRRVVNDISIEIHKIGQNKYRVDCVLRLRHIHPKRDGEAGSRATFRVETTVKAPTAEQAHARYSEDPVDAAAEAQKLREIFPGVVIIPKV